jgi:hypothetical protein
MQDFVRELLIQYGNCTGDRCRAGPPSSYFMGRRRFVRLKKAEAGKTRGTGPERDMFDRKKGRRRRLERLLEKGMQRHMFILYRGDPGSPGIPGGS